MNDYDDFDIGRCEGDKPIMLKLLVLLLLLMMIAEDGSMKWCWHAEQHDCVHGVWWSNNGLYSDLSYNQITSLPSTVFSGLNALATLFVSMMQIDDEDDDDPKHPSTVFVEFEEGIIDFTVSLT